MAQIGGRQRSGGRSSPNTPSGRSQTRIGSSRSRLLGQDAVPETGCRKYSPGRIPYRTSKDRTAAFHSRVMHNQVTRTETTEPLPRANATSACGPSQAMGSAVPRLEMARPDALRMVREGRLKRDFRVSLVAVLGGHVAGKMHSPRDFIFTETSETSVQSIEPSEFFVSHLFFEGETSGTTSRCPA